MLTLTLPYPPSINGYYATVQGRRVISARGRAYRLSVARTVPRITRLSGRLDVDMDVYPASRRRMDLDNLWKGLLDALTHAGLWEDDSQIDRLCVTRRDVVKDGAVVLRIRSWDAPPCHSVEGALRGVAL